jgi:thiamine-phosphate pyrophosphorylase
MSPVLCLITDRRMHGPEWQEGIVAQVSAAARAGVPLIQVREPGLDGGALRDLVGRCIDAVRGTRTRVVVNERLDVALAAGAHGVHLRGDSMPAWRVRGLCPRPFLIGRSVHTVDEASRADVTALDYLVFGTVFATSSKPGRAPAGVGELAAAVAATTLPVLAVGGVTLETMPEVIRAGAAGAAAIGLFAHDVGQVMSAARRGAGSD